MKTSTPFYCKDLVLIPAPKWIHFQVSTSEMKSLQPRQGLDMVSRGTILRHAEVPYHFLLLLLGKVLVLKSVRLLWLTYVLSLLPL